MQQINKLVKSEIEYHSGNASRVFIVGLNQGCCIGLASYFKLDTSLGALGGIFGYGGVYCANFNWDKVDVALKRKTPIEVRHGKKDFIVPWAYA